MTVRVGVEPALLLWAVERAGWSDETIAQRAPYLDAWLHGTHPTLKQLEDFAHKTHTPLGLLFLNEPPDEPVPIPDMRTMGNAAIERPTVDLLDTIYSCQSRQDWYRNYALSHGYSELDFVGSTTVSDDPDESASKVRRLLNFELPQRSVFTSWDDARRKLIDRIEDVGVLVVLNGVVGADTHRKLNPKEFRGFALGDDVAPLIFINGADTKAAQIFTMIHELAHIWLGQSALSDANMAKATNNRSELWCNQVAAEVLVPRNDLISVYSGEPTIAELERLSRRYRTSTLVILKRIYDARFLGWDEYQERYANERQRIMDILRSQGSSDGGGSFYNTQPLRLSRKFARAVISDTFEGGTAYRDAYHLLGTKKHQTFQNLIEKIGAA